MKKKVLAKICSVLLMGSMVLSMAACGNEGNTGSSGNGENESNSAVGNEEGNGSEAGGSDESGGAQEHELPEAKDLGGRTIRIALWWDEYFDSRFQTLEEIVAAGGSYDKEDQAQMRLDKVREIEERWNCRIEYVNAGWEGETNSISTSVVNGTPDYDVYLTDLQFSISPVANGYAYSLSEIAPADSDVLNDQTILSTFPCMGYEDYFFYGTYPIPSGATYLAYNASMLDDMGLEYPEALAERGEWTWEKFAEYCLLLTKDTDADGNTDVYGYGGTNRAIINALMASNNTAVAASATEGLSDPKTVEVFNFLERLYNTDGSARPFTNDWNNDIEALWEGKVAFTFTWFYLLPGRDVDFDVRICPYPVGPSGDGTKTATQAGNLYIIPVGVEDPTSVYMVMEELSNWYNWDTSLRDDADWFESGFVDEEQLALAYREGSKENAADFWHIIWGMPVGSVWDAVITNKEMSVSQAIETYKQQAQDALDALLGN